MTMPGRAVWMVTRRLFQARSMTIFATAALWSFFLTYLTDFQVRVQEIRILFRVGVPARTPVPGQSEAVAGRIYFLSHRRKR